MSRLSAQVQRSVVALVMTVAIGAGYAQSPATFPVGADEVCDYPTIQHAANVAASHPGEDFIHAARNGVYIPHASKIGTQDLETIGGFDTCNDPTAESGLRLPTAQGDRQPHR